MCRDLFATRQPRLNCPLAHAHFSFDDRDARAGEKFADADLIGIPHRVVVSAWLIQAGEFEYKLRTSDKAEMLSRAEVLAKVS